MFVPAYILANVVALSAVAVYLSVFYFLKLLNREHAILSLYVYLLAKSYFLVFWVHMFPLKLLLLNAFVPPILFLSFSFRNLKVSSYLKEAYVLALIVSLSFFYVFDKTISTISWLTTVCFTLLAYVAWFNLPPLHFIHRVTVATLMFSDIRELTVIFYLDFKLRGILLYTKVFAWVFGGIAETWVSRIGLNGRTLLSLVPLIYVNAYPFLPHIYVPYEMFGLFLRLCPAPFLLLLWGNEK